MVTRQHQSTTDKEDMQYKYSNYIQYWHQIPLAWLPAYKDVAYSICKERYPQVVRVLHELASVIVADTIDVVAYKYGTIPNYHLDT